MENPWTPGILVRQCVAKVWDRVRRRDQGRQTANTDGPRVPHGVGYLNGRRTKIVEVPDGYGDHMRRERLGRIESISGDGDHVLRERLGQEASVVNDGSSEDDSVVGSLFSSGDVSGTRWAPEHAQFASGQVEDDSVAEAFSVVVMSVVRAGHPSMRSSQAGRLRRSRAGELRQRWRWPNSGLS